MELKDYQKQVIADLDEFCNRIADNEPPVAYREFWESRGVTLSANDDNLCPYNNDLQGIPRVTIKVPTAGGKTFIACNAVRSIFNHYDEGIPKIVAWFVPSDTILEQTYKNLSNPKHPYRQKLDVLFGSKVQISNKQKLLQGQGFNPQTINHYLTICVFSIQSFATRSKDGRLVYRENGALISFEKELKKAGVNFSEGEHPSLVDVMKFLRPIVIIDESHRFTSELSKDFFELLNPRFILNLTATPRKKANIISFVSALKLKQNNMVKLPVVVYNLQEKNDVIASTINFRNLLEEHAKKSQEMGGEYIRPIALFQAESKTSEEKETFDKVKKMLVDCGIPESQIKIKTANINELKGVDLKSEECQVRYIITVNALKEGWDCPFAYILASLANKTSNIDVEQILGRILRQPYTRKHKSILLNQSYVYSCSSNFQATLESIVKGLNGAGFSDKDYRVAELENTEPKKITVVQRETLDFTSTSMENPTTASTGATNVKTSATEYMDDSVDTSYVSKQTSSDFTNDSIKYQIRQAEAAAQKAEQQQKDDLFSNPTGVAEEVKEKQKLNMTKIQEKHLARAKKISLPQFFIKTPNNGFFIDEDSHKLLDKTDLYVNFNLDEQDKKLDLINIGNNNIAVFDLTEENDYLLKRIDINSQQTMLIQQTYAMYGRELKIEQFAKQIGKSIRLDAISEPKITNYAKAVLANYNDEELQMLFDNQQNVMAAFSKKIKSLLIHHSEKKFKDFLTTGKITIEPSYKFAEEIILEKKESSLQRTLYTSEHGDMNPLEKKVAVYISQLPNVVFWHRNLERGKGFCINGFINHYPDFIVLTEKGNIVIVETKGDDRTNTDSKAKLSLGTKWADKAGSQYHYFMVFENNEIEGSKSITEFINLLKQM